MSSFSPFVKRHNRDLSIDSICTKCYRTIASADEYSELASKEQLHLCDPNGEVNQPIRTKQQSSVTNDLTQ